MTDDTHLAITDATKEYDDDRALDGVSVAFPAEGVHVLAGPNGSGKSTLLRLAAGIETPTEGSVDLPDGADIGVSFQEPSFHPTLTVAENLTTFGRLSNASAERIDDLADRLRLDVVDSRRAEALSGGYQQLLDLVLAVGKQPDFLLLDEPLTGLDDDSRHRVLSLIEETGKDCAVIVIAHRLAQFDGIADTITVVADGDLEAGTRSTDDIDDLEAWYIDRAGFD